MANGLAKQTISLDPKDHDFFVHKERGFKPLVKTVGPTKKSEKKLKVRPAPIGFITASFRVRHNRTTLSQPHHSDASPTLPLSRLAAERSLLLWQREEGEEVRLWSLRVIELSLYYIQMLVV